MMWLCAKDAQVYIHYIVKYFQIHCSLLGIAPRQSGKKTQSFQKNVLSPSGLTQ
jgi:hypothetical protein